MRSIIFTAAAVIWAGIPAAGAADIQQCRAIKADAERLKCFDAALAAPEEPPPAAESRWQVTEKKSPLDDSLTVIAALPASSGKGVMMMRCQERKTVVYFADPTFFSCGTMVPVTYRVDQGKPLEARWEPATQCTGAFADNPIAFARGLKNGSKLFVRLQNMAGSDHDMTFNLTGIVEARAKIAAACGWSKQIADR
jgi:hypothetical protein